MVVAVEKARNLGRQEPFEPPCRVRRLGADGPHPDMWNMFGELGEKRDEVAWLVNQQVVQTGINKGLPFEYSLNGIPVEKIETEQQAIEAIFSGATNSEIMDILKTDYLPVRIKEIQVLQEAGYEITFDEIKNTFLLVEP